MKDKNFIYGTRSVIEAVEAGRQTERIFIQQGISNPLLKELKLLLSAKNISYQAVPEEKLNRLTGKNHQGVVCFLSETDYYNIEQVIPELFEEGKTPLVLLLDRITDVRNFGAICRSAECAGAQAVIIPVSGSAQVTADAVKTSAGALNRIKVCREHNLKNTIDFLKASGLQVIACTEKSEELVYAVDFTLPTVIIFGSEENGISHEYLKRSDRKVKIPMEGKITSLNVSVAAGIILFEAVRQRL